MVYLSSSPPLRMLVQRISDINVRFVQESTPGQDRRLPGNFKWISTCPTLAAPIDIPMQTMQVFRHIYSSKLLLSRRTCWTWQAIWNCYKDKQVDCCLATSTNWLGSCSSNWDHLFSVTWTGSCDWWATFGFGNVADWWWMETLSYILIGVVVFFLILMIMKICCSKRKSSDYTNDPEAPPICRVSSSKERADGHPNLSWTNCQIEEPSVNLRHLMTVSWKLKIQKWFICYKLCFMRVTWSS